MSKGKGKGKSYDDDKEEIIKIILVGNSGVGKTSIINRFYDNSYTNTMFPTIAMNYIEKPLDIKGKKIKVSIWDTAGQEQYKSCNKLFIKNSKIVIFVYDISKKLSFVELEFWYNTIKNELGESPLLGLVGNKADLIDREEITEEEGSKRAEEWDAYFSLLSAKTDKKGIDKYFKKITQLFLESNKQLTISPKIKLGNKDISKFQNKRGCCGGGGESKEYTTEKDFKILFLGEKCVGKTNVINSILGKKINKKYEHSKKVHKNKYLCQLEDKRNINVTLIDTYQNYFQTIDCEEMIKYCKIIFLIFDINKKDTFVELKKYIEKINEILGKDKTIINILGNKINTNEKQNAHVTNEEGEKYAKEVGAIYEMISLDDSNSLQNIIKKNIQKCL